ncbi:hypothetical protein G5B10_07685 [Fluviicola sp. SGL-29]|nr:hypothetical protein [Fluviicola sp. SGL-29]
MRKNIYLIIGEGKCGKSTLVRAHTGVYRSGLLWLRLASQTDIQIKVWSQSCQEGGHTPQDVLRRINNDSAAEILITLRFKPAPQMAPFNAIDYYDLIQANHNIVGVVFMADKSIQNIPQFPTNPEPVLIPDSWETAANASADSVRRGWGWL